MMTISIEMVMMMMLMVIMMTMKMMMFMMMVMKMVIKREYKSGVEAAGGERRWRGGESNWIFKKCSLSATTRWPAW